MRPQEIVSWRLKTCGPSLPLPREGHAKQRRVPTGLLLVVITCSATRAGQGAIVRTGRDRCWYEIG